MKEPEHAISKLHVNQSLHHLFSIQGPHSNVFFKMPVFSYLTAKPPCANCRHFRKFHMQNLFGRHIKFFSGGGGGRNFHGKYHIILDVQNQEISCVLANYRNPLTGDLSLFGHFLCFPCDTETPL